MSIIVRDALGAQQTVETLPPKGQAVMANSLPVALASDQPALPIASGAPGDTPPALATNASGLIGWLRKIVDTLTGGIGFAAGETHIGEVGGNSAVAVASFNRPANVTAYASGQLVANSVTAGSVTPLTLAVARKNGGTGIIRRGRLTKSGTTATNASFRAHFFKSAPTPANGDGGTLTTDQALTYMGSMDFDMTGTVARAFSDGVKCISTPNVGSEILFDAGAGVQTIYALLEARAAYTPVSGETFTLALEVMRD